MLKAIRHHEHAHRQPDRLNVIGVKSYPESNRFDLEIADELIPTVDGDGTILRKVPLSIASRSYESGTLHLDGSLVGGPLVLRVYRFEPSRNALIIYCEEEQFCDILEMFDSLPLIAWLYPFNYLEGLKSLIENQFVDRSAFPKQDLATYEAPLWGGAASADPRFSEPQSGKTKMIWGPPGTGKTRKAAELIVNAFQSGEDVLCLAPSNVAADQLALAIADAVSEDYPGEVLRFNSPNENVFDRCKWLIEPCDKVYEINIRLKEIAAEMRSLRHDDPSFSDRYNSLKRERRTLWEKKREYMNTYCASARVLITTIYQWIGCDLVRERKDSRIVLDEAAMIPIISVTSMFRYLLNREHIPEVVILGDFRQLPPVCDTSKGEAKLLIEHWFAQSVFDAAGCADQDIRSELRRRGILESMLVQRRMHPEIAEVVSRQFYDGQLTTEGYQFCQIAPLRDEGAIRWIVPHEWFLPDGRLPIYVTNNSSEEHIYLVQKLVRHLLNRYVGASLAIVTPFRNQAAKYAEAFQEDNQIVTGTVHRLQGCEVDIVVFDIVDPLKPFTKDPRLINVAISRARHQVILMGNET